METYEFVVIARVMREAESEDAARAEIIDEMREVAYDMWFED